MNENITLDIDLKYILTRVMTVRNKRWRENPELKNKERVITYAYIKYWAEKDNESDFEDDPDEEEVLKEIEVLKPKLHTIKEDSGEIAMFKMIRDLCDEGEIHRGIPLVKNWGEFRRQYIIVDDNGYMRDEEMNNYNINNKLIK